MQIIQTAHQAWKVAYSVTVGVHIGANGKAVDHRVTTIWLMPFQISPCRDDGYDVSDYYGVDPRYGTLSIRHMSEGGFRVRCHSSG